MLYRVRWRIGRQILRMLFGALGGFRRRGVENVPDRGGVLLCPNHVCDADPAAVLLALPRPAYFMAKAELFDIRFLGRVLRSFRAFPIRRDIMDRAALRYAEDLLKRGEAVVIFPEGGGNPDGVLQPLFPGALLIALRTGVPVVPVALRNTQRVLPYGSVVPRRSPEPVCVTFGPPLDLSDLKGKRGSIELATRRLTETLAAMLGQPIPEGEPQRGDADTAPLKVPSEPRAADVQPKGSLPRLPM